MSLTHYFSETNGKDIRMVYNGTLRILNSSLWEPHFALPTVGSTLWAVERGTFIAECDIGEIFQICVRRGSQVVLWGGYRQF